MASPTPTSAAATAMMYSAKTLPSRLLCNWLNANRLLLTELRMTSIDISTITAFLRAITPYTPMQNSTAPRRRNSLRSISVLPGEHDCTDDGSEQNERQRPERQQEGLEHAVAELRGGHLGSGLQPIVAEALDQDVEHRAQHQQRHR